MLYLPTGIWETRPSELEDLNWSVGTQLRDCDRLKLKSLLLKLLDFPHSIQSPTMCISHPPLIFVEEHCIPVWECTFFPPSFVQLFNVILSHKAIHHYSGKFCANSLTKLMENLEGRKSSGWAP